MQPKINTSPASVMIFCLMMMAGLLFLSQQLITSVYVSSRFIRTMVDREHAEALALGGFQVAIAQLMVDKTDERPDKKNKDAAQPDEKENKQKTALLSMLKRVIPHLNRWQKFEFTEKNDGFDGELKICISCEQGKLNINNIFDFQTMDFKKPFDQIMKSLEMKNKLKPGQIYTRVIEFFKKRKRRLDDISQLLQIPDLEALDIAYNPPVLPEKKKQSSPNVNVTLQDLFTTWSDGVIFEPLMLSDALCAVFGVRRPQADDAQVMREQYEQFFTKYDPTQTYDWEQSWDILEPLYGPKPKSIASIKGIFTKQFGAKVFSVLSCGKVGSVESHALAIIREVEAEDTDQKTSDDENQPDASDPSTKKQKVAKQKKSLRIVRLYWI